MKVVKQITEKVPIESIEDGDTFMYGDYFHIKMAIYDALNLQENKDGTVYDHIGLDVADGSLTNFDVGDLVTPVAAEFVVKCPL